MVPDQVIVLEKHLPSSLSARQALGLFEVSQVLVVSENSDQVGGASEILAPFCQGMYDCEELSIIYVIVLLGGGEGLREVGTGVKVAIRILLHEHAPGHS